MQRSLNQRICQGIFNKKQRSKKKKKRLQTAEVGKKDLCHDLKKKHWEVKVVPNLTADQRIEENSGMRRCVLPVSEDKEVILQPSWQHHRSTGDTTEDGDEQPVKDEQSISREETEVLLTFMISRPQRIILSWSYKGDSSPIQEFLNSCTSCYQLCIFLFILMLSACLWFKQNIKINGKQRVLLVPVCWRKNWGRKRTRRGRSWVPISL